jgi:hypothetical protein
MLFHFN